MEAEKKEEGLTTRADKEPAHFCGKNPVFLLLFFPLVPSSSGLGRWPLTPETGVRNPLGLLISAWKGLFSALAASARGIACAAYESTPPLKTLASYPGRKIPPFQTEIECLSSGVPDETINLRESMQTFNTEGSFLERLPHNADLLHAIEGVFLRRGIRMGGFAVIGAVKNSVVGFYDQHKRTYKNIAFDETAEILSCIGNVSEVEGAVSVHAHITLGCEDGLARGGHLMEGTKIFAGEIFGVALSGEQLTRSFDEITGLKLWAAEKTPR